jgi:hypothetical protein
VTPGRPLRQNGEAFGDMGFMVEDPKDLHGALDAAMNHRISQASARKPQEFRRHS